MEFCDLFVLVNVFWGVLEFLFDSSLLDLLVFAATSFLFISRMFSSFLGHCYNGCVRVLVRQSQDVCRLGTGFCSCRFHMH